MSYNPNKHGSGGLQDNLGPFTTRFGRSVVTGFNYSTLPEKVDLRPYLGPVRDQGVDQGSCSAFTAMVIKEYHESKEDGMRSQLSPQFVFNFRQYYPLQGMTGQNTMEILRDHGICTEGKFPYGITIVKAPTGMSQNILNQADNFKIKSYAVITTINEAKAALHMSGPLYISVPLYSDATNGQLWKSNGSGYLAGYHAMAIVGYDAKGFIIRNSWGPTWNGNGHTKMFYTDFPKATNTDYTILTAVDKASNILNGLFYLPQAKPPRAGGGRTDTGDNNNVEVEKPESSYSYDANRHIGERRCVKCYYKAYCEKTIFEYDFTKAGWIPEDFPIVFGNDGTVTVDQNGIMIDSVPFNSTAHIGNEHAKWLRFYKNPFVIKSNAETRVSAKFAVQQVIPFNDIPNKFLPRLVSLDQDIRLASAAVGAVFRTGPGRGLVFSVYQTNGIIYGLYERLSMYFDIPREFASFTFLFEIGRRTNQEQFKDFADVSIGINPTEGVVRWYVNGIEKFKINQIGYRIEDKYKISEEGVANTLVDLTNQEMEIGFGTFSQLDMALTTEQRRNSDLPLVNTDQQAVSALVQLETTDTYRELYPGLQASERDLLSPDQTFAYVLNETLNDNRAVKLFGQGSILSMNSLKIERFNEIEKKAKYKNHH